MEHEDTKADADALLIDALAWLARHGHAPILGLGSGRHRGLRRVARPGPEFDREFYDLFEQHRSHFLARARAAGAGDTAEDVVQTAFLNVWYSQQNRPREITNLRYYLITAVRNEVYEELRRRWRALPVDNSEDLLANLPSEQHETGTRVSNAMAVRDALTHLSSPHREVVILRLIDDYTMARTAEITGYTVDKVKRVTHEAVTKLRAALSSEIA
ncbi:RNA polymerase sigma factor [Pseudonocardia sp. NPDC049635]|uniref:RNA polymerase sigma factor n=1 Tax=Pseudonocardia sp. NPDC049635 TaxID=3155506 RepID=UPI0033D103B5